MRVSHWLGVGVSLVPALAFGWGSYGHEQINHAAVKLLAAQNSEIGGCFTKNILVLTRYAITPDYEWKLNSIDKTNIGNAKKLGTPIPPLLKKKATADSHEHPLHFFETDAFVARAGFTPEKIANLPDSSYATAFTKYRDLLLANLPWVKRVDPAKSLKDPKEPTVKEVAAHGTAPWRITQLYAKGVDALKSGNFELAALYLGTLGHYVGDMSQPFHAALNYDGQYYHPTARGIHAAYETRMLDAYAKKTAKAKQDSNSKMWDTFNATEGAVLASAKEFLDGGVLTRLERDKTIHVLFSMISKGFHNIDFLLPAFTYAKNGSFGNYPPEMEDPSEPAHQHHENEGEQKNDEEPSVPMAVIHKFAELDLEKPDRADVKYSVVDSATTLMGRSSAVLARLWLGAYEEAGSPAMAKCKALVFSSAAAIEAYENIVPDYYPNGTQMEE